MLHNSEISKGHELCTTDLPFPGSCLSSWEEMLLTVSIYYRRNSLGIQPEKHFSLT
jgi:hypothetical protein